MTETFTRESIDTGYTQVPHGLWTLDMSGNARCLLGWLHSHTPAYLAKLSVNRCEQEFGGGGSIRVWLRELTDAGFLTMTKQGNRWVITLLAEPWMSLHRRARTHPADSAPADPAPADPAPQNPPIRREEPADSAPIEDHLEDHLEKRASRAVDRRLEDEPPAAEDLAGKELCTEMADAIEAWGAKRPTPTKTWCRDIDRMVRIDGRAPDEIRRVIHWLYESGDEVAVFWAPNVQCPAKLRAKWEVIAGQVRRHQATTPQESSIDLIRRIRGAS